MRAVCLFSAFLLIQPQPQPQLAVIDVRADAAVPGLPPDRPHFEPHLASSPTDARHLLGVTTVSDAAAVFTPTQSCASVVTFDAGATWAVHTFALQNCVDPWVALGAGGDAFFTAMGTRPGIPGHRLYFFRSTDGGRTWVDPPVDFGTGHDHPTITVQSAGAATGTLFLVSGVGRRDAFATFRAFIVRSDDAGRSWQTPAVLTASNLNMNTLAGGLLPDGTLLVPFIDLQPPPFSSPDNMLSRRRAWVYYGSKGGTEFAPPLYISEECGGAGGFPSAAVTPGSARAFFICHSSQGSGIVVHVSDGGILWSRPVPVDLPPANVQQRAPTIAAARDGVVAVTWQDSRESPADCFRLRAALSTDGATFTAARFLSTASSCPQIERNGAAGKRWRHGGDYMGLAAGTDGTFHALWADSRTGISQLHFASFRGKN